MSGYTPIPITRRRRWLVALAAFGLALAAPTAGPPVAQAGGDIVVDTTLDEMTANGKCSLREAVQAANTHTTVDTCAGVAGANVIVLSFGTYTLTIPKTGANDNNSGNLNLTSDITLGPLPCVGFCFSTIIQGGPGWNDQIILVTDNALVTLTGLTIQGGRSAQSGGGVQVNGSTLVVTGTVLYDNTAVINGGGLFSNSSNTTIINSVILSNSAAAGGGWYGLGATFELRGSTIMSNTTFQHGGGGIAVSSGAALTVTRSALIGNLANSSGGALSATHSTVSLSNATISGNRTRWYGGGLYAASSSADLTNVTIAYNTADLDHDEGGSGGGLSTDTPVTITIGNSILALNSDLSAGTVEPDCSATLTSRGYNLIRDTTGCTITGNTAGNLLGADPRLLPLVSNNGWVHPLHFLSPAIDAGDPILVHHSNVCVPTDQRGRPRPIDGDGDGISVCDMGAYEVQTTTLIRRVRLPLVRR